MNITDAERVMREMTATFPTRTLDDPQLMVWLRTLEPYALPVALAAVSRLRETSKFMPAHAEFIAAAEFERARADTRVALAGGDGPCRACGGDGFVELRPSIVRPCPRCRAVEFARWAGRHFAREHTCPECSDLRTGGPDTRYIVDEYRRRAAELGADEPNRVHAEADEPLSPEQVRANIARLKATLSGVGKGHAA